MAELSLIIGGENANTLDLAIFMFSLSSVLQWFFFVLVAFIVAKNKKKKNANSDKFKHSRNNHRKGR